MALLLEKEVEHLRGSIIAAYKFHKKSLSQAQIDPGKSYLLNSFKGEIHAYDRVLCKPLTDFKKLK
jgi:hypothetical protein